jgi:pimeloyl-ACP methyl ester carboxylesterase
MASINEYESKQIEKTDEKGLTPVVFIHGLWLLPSSWDRWQTFFEKAGYCALTPGWPDDPQTVEEANEHPEVFAHKTVGQVADHFAEVIGKLKKKPAVIGHSIFQAATANLNPWTKAKVDTKSPERGPLLIISGEKDHTVPWAIANASFKKQERNTGVTEIVEIPNRGHALTIDKGWREVAETALAFVKRF